MIDLMMKFLAAGLTDIGKRRQRNEDNLLLLPEYGVVAVADGMGGHHGGAEASQAVIEALRDHFSDKHPRSIESVERALMLANGRVLAEGKATGMRNMGSTAVVLCATYSDGKPSVIVGHLGDSRCYRIRVASTHLGPKGRITPLTEDHSLIVQVAKMHGKTVQQMAAEGYPSNTILEACGLRADCQPTVRQFSVKRDDVFVLCSDGLHGEIDDAAIAEIVALSDGAGLPRVAKKLVQAALDAGGRDNVTVVVCKIV
jgi:protein phosphatase